VPVAGTSNGATACAAKPDRATCGIDRAATGSTEAGLTSRNTAANRAPDATCTGAAVAGARTVTRNAALRATPKKPSPDAAIYQQAPGQPEPPAP
jgi:hypothetical protein